jgi:tRNA (cytidine/uridine-2'-O-)-methyltransferase
MFHIVLAEPEIPPNTGNVIRLCANSGARLHLVKPLGFTLEAKQLQRAGLDYHDLVNVQVHEDIGACLRTLQGSRLFVIETTGAKRYTEPAFQRGDGFIFGSETRGLGAAWADAVPAERWLHIPMANATRSLNLSNSVALVLFEAWRQQDFDGADR